VGLPGLGVRPASPGRTLSYSVQVITRHSEALFDEVLAESGS
jgi:hypothetical protein